MRPDDMKAWGLKEDQIVRVSSRRGSIQIKVRADDKSPAGTVFCSFSFNQVPVNILTGGGYDPVTYTAGLKVCPVRLEPVNAI